MIKRNLEVGLASLRANPLRSFLTMSGVIIGIAAVVAVLSIGKGHEQRIEAEVQRMGTNLFWVNPPRMAGQAGRFLTSQNAVAGSSRFNPLRVEDADAIRKYCSAIQSVAPVLSCYERGTVDGKPVQLELLATNSSYLRTRSFALLSGRYLADEDIRRRSNVCVVEEAPGLNLLLDHKNYVSVAGIRFKIVGLVKQKELQSFPRNSFTVHIPITVSQESLTGTRQVHSIFCLAKDGMLDIARKQVEMILGSRNEGDSRFEIQSTRDIFEGMETLTRTATLVTAGVGALALFVGGIGIMNILLASVLERTKEVGLRKSVGARRKDILLQFLFESVSFSVVGGILGVGLGIVTTGVLAAAIDIPTAFSIEAILVGLVFSSAVGTVFGVYPAWKAANLDPIEALRYE